MSIATDRPVLESREVNEHGCMIDRGEAADAGIGVARGTCRYTYDEALCPTGWQQYDTMHLHRRQQHGLRAPDFVQAHRRRKIWKPLR